MVDRPSVITLLITGSKTGLLLCAETAETQPQCHILPSASHHIMIPCLPLSPLYDLPYRATSMFWTSYMFSKPFTRRRVLLSTNLFSCLSAFKSAICALCWNTVEHRATSWKNNHPYLFVAAEVASSKTTQGHPVETLNSNFTPTSWIVFHCLTYTKSSKPHQHIPMQCFNTGMFLL